MKTKGNIGKSLIQNKKKVSQANKEEDDEKSLKDLHSLSITEPTQSKTIPEQASLAQNSTSISLFHKPKVQRRG